MHQGDDATPFLTVRNMRFRRGEWTYVKGESGSGKTSLIKAINGLWPYGRGDIVFPEGVKTFYAAQDVKLPQLTLKELVCLPDAAATAMPTRVSRQSCTRPVSASSSNISATKSREGKIWDQVLSGGQKQKLVVARILLHQPGLLFLDEASGALDPEAKVAFHQAIKDNCPRVTVISVMHEAIPPRSATGRRFYDSVLSLPTAWRRRRRSSRACLPNSPTIVAQARPAEAQAGLRFPVGMKLR